MLRKTQNTLASSNPAVVDRPGAGLHFEPAATLPDVIDAWSLVYDAYFRAGLIRGNPYGVHTVKHAIQSNSTVIRGRIEGRTVCTISAYFDQPNVGLPLDQVYPDELGSLRDQGRTLMEIGLFADRRKHIERSIEALLELIRQVYYFGVHFGTTDGVIGVHPRHAAFYRRMIGFEPIGEEKTYALVNDRPVVLLRLDWQDKCKQPHLPRGLRYFRDNPLPPQTYAQRCVLNEHRIAGSPIQQFIKQSADQYLAVG